MGLKKKRDETSVVSSSSSKLANPAPDNRDHDRMVATGLNEIDQIFMRGKAKRKQEDIAEGVKQDSGEGHKNKKTEKASKKSKHSTAGSEEGVSKMPLPSRPRKKTKDGYSVYTEDELGWNRKNAGGTPLCPFDCDCCF